MWYDTEGERSALADAAPDPAAWRAYFGFPADEGYVKGASTTGSADSRRTSIYTRPCSAGPVGASPFRAQVVRWARTEPGTHMQTEEIVDANDVTEPAPMGNGLTVRCSPVRGTLPRLRFGHNYRIRARLVDLAGNSLRLDDPDVGALEQATDAIMDGRFEPVDPPALVLTRRVTEAKSLERSLSAATTTAPRRNTTATSLGRWRRFTTTATSSIRRPPTVTWCRRRRRNSRANCTACSMPPLQHRRHAREAGLCGGGARVWLADARCARRAD